MTEDGLYFLFLCEFPCCVLLRIHGASLRATPSRDPSPLWSLKMPGLPWRFTNWYMGVIRLDCVYYITLVLFSFLSFMIFNPFLLRSCGLQVSRTSEAGRSRCWVTSSWRGVRAGRRCGTRSWPSWFTTCGACRRIRTVWGVGCCWPAASVPSPPHQHWTNTCSSMCSALVTL